MALSAQSSVSERRTEGMNATYFKKLWLMFWLIFFCTASLSDMTEFACKPTTCASQRKNTLGLLLNPIKYTLHIFLSRQLILYRFKNIFSILWNKLITLNLIKTVEFDKSLITRTTITTKSILDSFHNTCSRSKMIMIDKETREK